MERLATLLSFLLVAVFWVGPAAHARTVKGAAAEDIAAAAAAYVGSIQTLAASFDFVSVRGKTKGHIFMDRERRAIRMQCGRPLNHLLLVNGPLIQFYGGDGTVVETATAGTPLAFLLEPTRSLADDIKVLEVDERGDSVYIAVAERDNVAGGQIILHFKRRPVWRLIDWGAYDAQGRYTQTVLGTPETGLRLDPALFQPPE